MRMPAGLAASSGMPASSEPLDALSSSRFSAGASASARDSSSLHHKSATLLS